MGAEREGEVSGLAELWTCVWCMSVYVCGLLGVMLLPWDVWWVPTVLAGSAIAIVVDRWAT